MIDDTITGYILLPNIKHLFQAYGATKPDIVRIENTFKYPVKKYYTDGIHAYSWMQKMNRCNCYILVFNVDICSYIRESHASPRGTVG